MSEFSEEALRKSNKHETIANIQEQDVKHERDEKYMENPVAEVKKKLTSSFAKLKSELAISKNTTTVLSGRLVQMERKCWANAQYSRRKYVETVGIPSSVHQNQLEDSICKISNKLNCKIDKNNLEDFHRLKGDRVIVKFSKRKDCMLVLSVKNDLKIINMAELGFDKNGSIYISQSLCSYYKILCSWSKKLHNMGRIYSWFVCGGTIEIQILEDGNFV